MLKCGHQISTVAGDECGENCEKGGLELFFTCISCTDFVTIQYLIEKEIMSKWKRLSMQGIKLLENSLQNTLLDLGREIVVGRFKARGRGCKQVPPRHADTVKLILAFRLKGIVSALTRANSVADIEPEFLLFCSDFMGPTPIHLQPHLNEITFMKRNILKSPAEFRSMMVKTTVMEYLFLVLLEEESLKRMVEGYGETTQQTIKSDTELQHTSHQRHSVELFLRGQTEDLRSVSPTPSFKEAKMSGTYYQPHPDNETSPTPSRPPVWKYEADQNVHSPTLDRKFATPVNGKCETPMNARFDSPMNEDFDTPMQGIVPIPFRLGGSPVSFAGQELSFAATRKVFEGDGVPSGRSSTERFPRIPYGDAASAIASRIREPAKPVHETEERLPKSNIQKYLKPQVAAGSRRKTVGSGPGYNSSQAAAAPAAAVPPSSQLPRIPKAVASAASQTQKGNARLVPPKLRSSTSTSTKALRPKKLG